ncbi:MAG: efflux RND transporter periplasmic adaptor subunit [Azoarcus sp.]|nr:efflux RND transporter periplasmic adaptor subunit [Azoarcus sp.]
MTAAIGVVALAACGWLGSRLLPGNDKANAAYQFSTVVRGDIEDLVTATGTLQPRDYVDVGAQVSGQLKKLLVQVGSEVKAGDLLAEIDSTVYLSKVDASRASLRNLKAQLKEREAQLTLAQIQYRRQQALMAEDATTTEALQTSEATLKSAQASLEALRAQIEQTESTLRGDEANLQYAQVLAPMNGTVVSISARQGQTLNVNQQAPTILRIADLSTMTVQTQVSEADISRLSTGMKAYFTTLGGGNKRWYGTLNQIEPTPTTTNNVVLYNALFDVPNPDGRLMTNMTAQVFFIVAQAKNVLQIPMGALQQTARVRSRKSDTTAGAQSADTVSAAAATTAAAPTTEAKPATVAAESPAPATATEVAKPKTSAPKYTVKVLEAGNKIVERPVEIGVTSRIVAEVKSGLAEGDKVVSGLADGGEQAAASTTRRTMPPRL